ncbi:phosphomannomutase/phosphoglucomutase [Candidatus Woesearchaeota archaeon]|nr:phosphomannomutase/phosphoglucomutase [Candidatus Woesearchaeota archaeon]
MYPVELDERLAYKIGRAFVAFLKCDSVVVGRDMRGSSPSLFKALTDGITDQGADVVDIGLVTTPMLSFSVANFNYSGGIMISASHNPAQYNAFKLIRPKGVQMHSDSIDQIRGLVEKGSFDDARKGSINQKDVLKDYLDHVKGFAEGIRDLKIVFDYGNGMGALTARPLFDSLPVEAIHMYPEMDMSFPNHPANPHEIGNFRDLQKRVVMEKADCGIFFDGDADRCQFVDEKGELVFPDMLLALLASDELKHHQGEKVYYDLRFSKAVEEDVRKDGGIPIKMRVGNPFYKEKLVNEGGILAGEFSGHVMFRDNFCIDDGLFCSVKALAILAKSGRRLSELIAPIDRYAHTEEINMVVDDADMVLSRVKSAFSDGRSSDIDGVYIEYDDWWFSLRKSNTEPLVRLRIEADNKVILEEKRSMIIGIIEGK